MMGLPVNDNHRYLLGMEPAEVQRLERQHEAWRTPTERVWELAGFAAGQTIIDLGCGPGFTSLDLATIVGEQGRIVAVDSSAVASDFLRSTAKRRSIANLEVVTADVTRFDMSGWDPEGVFARWLLCFLPDPEPFVQRVASGMPVGATLAVMDYWNYMAIRTEPCTPLFKKVFQAVYDSFAGAGGSLDVAGRMPKLFRMSGLRVVRVVPICQVGGPGSPVWRWLADFQALYLPTLVQKEYLTPGELDEYKDWWREQESNPDAVFSSPPILCVIGVKE